MTKGMIVAFVTSAMLLGALGCAAPPVSPPPNGLGDAPAVAPRVAVTDRQIALDLTNAVVQLVDAEAPLAFSSGPRADEPVSGALRTMLGEAGYTVVDASDAPPNARPFSHRVVTAKGDGGLAQRHEIAVGDARLRRSYRMSADGTVQPTSALFVQGVDAAALRLIDARLFGVDGYRDGAETSPALPERLLARYGYLLNDAPVADESGDDGVTVAGRDDDQRPTDDEDGATACLPAATATTNVERRIALDFANAVVQLVDVETGPLVLPSAERDRDPVLDTLRTVLGEAGYAVVGAVDDTSGARAIGHCLVPDDDESVQLHEIAVGETRLRRRYRPGPAGAVQPASAMFVKGAEAGALRLMDGRLFGTDEESARPALPSEVLARYEALFEGEGVAGGRSPSGDGAIARGEGGTTLRPAGAATPMPAASASAESALAERPEDETDEVNAPSGNVRDLGESNYAPWLDALDLVVEHELVFDRGADQLVAEAHAGPIGDVVARFDAATDIVRIAGYSVGGGNDEAINRETALRRADSVRRAFVAAGVPAERVFIEGFWSDTREPGAPLSRAALVSLRRGGA